MKITVFPQYDRLVQLLTNIAAKASGEVVRPDVVAHDPAAGPITLRDRAVNLVSASGALALALPGPVPGKSLDFLVRIRAGDVEAAPSFTGPFTFEGDNPDALAPVPAGRVVLLYFAETEPGVLAVARKAVEPITQ